ncbi:hypothetical protein BDV93DRAFT_97122 [Ceratobasidium sp. AG-I]|nr:hypothetical protein BDV93DRAFT_97122 [Ceratobasidium sp. AG-I]
MFGDQQLIISIPLRPHTLHRNSHPVNSSNIRTLSLRTQDCDHGGLICAHGSRPGLYIFSLPGSHLRNHKCSTIREVSEPLDHRVSHSLIWPTSYHGSDVPLTSRVAHQVDCTSTSEPNRSTRGQTLLGGSERECTSR